MRRSIAHIRREYARHTFSERNADADPFVQFERWFDDAMRAEVSDPTAMTLATATKKGKPSARIVLLKGVDDRGFVFFTNIGSRKGKELSGNRRAALLFFWGTLDRQIRIEGKVERTPRNEAATYFNSRPRKSRISAWASHQSRVVPNREALERSFKEYSRRFNGGSIPVPPYWGGYRLIPASLEFWQGRENRLHDRILYTRKGKTWSLHRLAP